MAVGAQTIAAIRWGYGFRPGQVPPDGQEGLLAELDEPDAGAAPNVPDAITMLGGVRLRREARRAGEAEDDGMSPMMDEASEAVKELREPLLFRRILAPLLSPQGFRERLVTFWADHFTVAAKGPMLSLLAPHHVETAIRPHVGGSFADLVVAAELHPAMLVFLNQNDSLGPHSKAAIEGGKGLNENLAREILELHTLGVDGPYTQTDVRELAELLTGHTVNLEAGALFRAARAEPGAETVLGRTYGGEVASPGDAVAALRDLAVHEATARHVARKLVTHFVSDTPEPAHVAAVAAAFRGTGGALRPVYAALLGHEAAWAPVFGKARQHFDFVIAALRALGAGAGGEGPLGDPDEVARRSYRQLARMGQKLLEPSGPNGWPEEEGAWITPQGLAARIEVARALARDAEKGLDPRHFLDAALGDLAGGPLRAAVSAAETKWEGIALALLSPEFNRR